MSTDGTASRALITSQQRNSTCDVMAASTVARCAPGINGISSRDARHPSAWLSISGNSFRAILTEQMKSLCGWARAELAALAFQKGAIEPCVVCNDGMFADKFEQLAENAGGIRRPIDHRLRMPVNRLMCSGICTPQLTRESK